MELKEIVEKAVPHDICEDWFYSCPLADGGCCNDMLDKDKCYCGAEARRVNLITDIKAWAVGQVPSPNRKSCDNADHYFARFKEGFNSARRQTLDNIQKG